MLTSVTREAVRVFDDIDMLRMVEIEASGELVWLIFECNATRNRCGSDRVESIKVVGQGR